METENRTKRRVSRGRRSSIHLRQENASPTVINAPINNSIQGKTAKEQISEMKARLGVLAEYKAKLEEEKEEWKAVVIKYKERQSAMEAHSKAKNRQKIDVKVDKLLDDVGQRPEHVLTKIFNNFQEFMGNNTQKLRTEIAALKIDCSNQQLNIESVEKTNEHLGQIIKERSEEDFANKVELWIEARTFSQRIVAETSKFMETLEVLEKTVRE